MVVFGRDGYLNHYYLLFQEFKQNKIDGACAKPVIGIQTPKDSALPELFIRHEEEGDKKDLFRLSHAYKTLYGTKQTQQKPDLFGAFMKHPNELVWCSNVYRFKVNTKQKVNVTPGFSGWFLTEAGVQVLFSHIKRKESAKATLAPKLHPPKLLNDYLKKHSNERKFVSFYRYNLIIGCIGSVYLFSVSPYAGGWTKTGQSRTPDQ
jgi:hypothetical protein